MPDTIPTSAPVGPACPRERMAVVGRSLPRSVRSPLQSYFTWLTGKPARGERARAWAGPRLDTLWTALALGVGIALSLLALHLGPGGLWLLLPGWILTTGSLRKAFIVVEHGYVHGVLGGVADARAADLIGVLALLPGHARFRKDHVIRHHGSSFGGEGDPDAALLLRLGFEPGIPRHRLWRRLLVTLLSPRFHASFLRARMAEPFLLAVPQRILAALFWGGVLVAVQLCSLWWELALAWLVPALPLYHAAALVSIVGEHLWFTPRAEGESMSRYQRRLTSARFTGHAPPESRGAWPVRALRWGSWWLAHLTYWPAVRIVLVPGDLPAHDYHHSHPNLPWTDTLRERQQALETGEPLTEVWGAFAAVDRTFANMARLPWRELRDGRALLRDV